MTKTIVVHETGGPEQMQLEDIDLAAPETGQVLMRQSVIGVNFIDCYHRSGLYAMPLPVTPGMEGVGVVEEVGSDVPEFKVGDRVCYSSGPLGGYAESRLIPAADLVKVPESLTDEQLGGGLLRGMTAWYLIRQLRVLHAGETVLFHAAAGGVGLMFCQWAKALGVTVIGTVSSREKAAKARAAGCDHVIVYQEEDFVARVKEITDGRGVPVVYDGVGKDTFQPSLDCLEPRGLMVSFGNASGPPPALEVGSLAPKGSLFVTRPTLQDYIATRESYVNGMTELFEVISTGKVTNQVGQSYSLANAADAHRDLESRRTTGSTILLP